jgi:hypothetical protein
MFWYDSTPTVWTTEDGMTYINCDHDDLERKYKVPKEWVEEAKKQSSACVFVATEKVKKGKDEETVPMKLADYKAKQQAPPEVPPKEG